MQSEGGDAEVDAWAEEIHIMEQRSLAARTTPWHEGHDTPTKFSEAFQACVEPPDRPDFFDIFWGVKIWFSST